MSAPQIQYPPTSGGGTPTGGSGTANTIPLWTGSTPSTTLTDSLLSQASTIITNSGTFRTADGSNTEPGYTFTGSSGSGMYRGSSGTILRFASSGAFAFGVSSTGSVLIGGTATTTPGAQLDVIGTTVVVRARASSTNTTPVLGAEPGMTLRNTNSTVGNYTSITNRDSNDNANGQINFINVNHTGSGAINFVTRDSVGGSGERARIDSTGNFGIGETSPASYGRLAVTGSAVGAGILGMNTDATRVDIQSYNKPLAINRAGNNTLMNEGGGNVGIGTASPNAILSVYNAGTPTISLWNSSNYSRLSTNANDLYLDAGLGGAAGAVIFRRGSGTADSARIESNGRFIVAGTGATESLQVNAGFRVGGAANVATQTSAGPAIISYEYPTTRHYVGDNSGYSWAVSRRVASATFDLISITDNVGSLFVPAADSYFYGVRVGRGAGQQSTNTVVGNGALNANTSGSANTAVGASALAASTTANANTAVGSEAGNALTSNGENTFIGQQAGYFPTNGENTAVGRVAMRGIAGSSTGSSNTALGRAALYSFTTGIQNTALGRNAGFALSSGNNNVLIGERAAETLTTGSANIVIGRLATTAAATDSNQLVLGSATDFVATNGGATTYYATAGASLGYIQVRLNGANVKIQVFAP